MGKEIYIVTSAADVAAVYKETKALDFDVIIRGLLAEYGLTPTALDRLFDSSRFGNRSWMDREHDVFRAQMHPGSETGDALEAAFLGSIDELMHWDRLGEPMVISGGSSSGTDPVKIVSLWSWCGQVSIEASTRAFFGKSMLRAVPGFVADYIRLDDEFWALKSQGREAAAKLAFSTYQDRTIAAFSQWLALPKSKRADASWMMKETEKDFEAMGIVDALQIGAIYFAHSAVINGNAYQSCFWMLAHLLHGDEAILAAVRDEMNPALSVCSSSGELKVNMAHLLDTERCPLLSSVYEETIRFTNDALGVRLVQHETRLGNSGMLLRAGRMLLMPYRQMHFDEGIFGSNADKFDAMRFMPPPMGNTKGEKYVPLSKNSSFRPFGGGNGFCPGRFLARREVYMFAALFLFRFDVRLGGKTESKRAFPKMDVATRTGGILRPIPGDDLILEVRQVVDLEDVIR
ncbi:hypothetical protein N0V82_010344 [Gnomoniopsis sp. IMI 355080]|nr:hypothetical protein N0V82_010344 [Gnomoniopsis sp. IMI 355080]